MNIISAISSLIAGIRLTLSDVSVRKLATVPWLSALGLYPFSLLIAYYAHPYLLSWVSSPSDTFWGSLYYAVAWAVVGLVALLGSLFASFLVLLILLSFIQEPIARRVLVLSGVTIPTSSGGMLAETRALSSSVFRALGMLTLLAPLFLISLALSLIPILAPLGIACAAWILALQCFDPVFEVLQLSLKDRFKIAFNNKLAFAAFGLTVLLVAAIPLLGFIITPMAVAGAALDTAKRLRKTTNSDIS